MSDVLEWLRALPPGGVAAGAGALTFAETTLGLGFITPGETALFIAGTTVTSVVGFVVLWLVTSACAVLGYSGGYWIGKVLGPKVRQTKVVRKHGAHGWDKAIELLRRRGSFAVMFAIYLPVVRTLIPAAAGTSGLPFRKFLPAAAVAGTTWCALHLAIGAAAGEAAMKIEEYIDKGGWILLALVVAIGVTVALIKRRRAAKGALAGVGSCPERARGEKLQLDSDS